MGDSNINSVWEGILDTGEPRSKEMARWYLSTGLARDDEKDDIDKLIKYDKDVHLFILILSEILYFALLLFLLLGVDAFKGETGYKLNTTKYYRGIVQEDGKTVLVKNPNISETELYSLEDIGLEGDFTYLDEIRFYYVRNEDKTYSWVTYLPEERAEYLENIHTNPVIIGYLIIATATLIAFFVIKSKRNKWFFYFDARINRFINQYKLWEIVPKGVVGTSYDALIVWYSKTYPDEFNRDFPCCVMTESDKIKYNESDRKIKLKFAGAIAIIVAIVCLIAWVPPMIKDARTKRKNKAVTAKVEAQMETALEGNIKKFKGYPDYYDIEDMISISAASFPNETVYYYLSATEDYIGIKITTKEKKNVYVMRFTPENGDVGDDDTEYSLYINLISNNVTPDDILNNYTGIIDPDEISFVSE
jgi:hypothetical protein